MDAVNPNIPEPCETLSEPLVSSNNNMEQNTEIQTESVVTQSPLNELPIIHESSELQVTPQQESTSNLQSDNALEESSHSTTALNKVVPSKKEFTCKTCHKIFAFNSYLNIHERIHTGEKSFACDKCDKKFLHKHHLIDHKRIHSGEKPFSCDKCGKSFAQKTNLTRHLNKN